MVKDINEEDLVRVDKESILRGYRKKEADIVYRSVVLALMICVVYSIPDEVHQIFVTGRYSGVKDVFIDSTGAKLELGFIYSLVE